MKEEPFLNDIKSVLPNILEENDYFTSDALLFNDISLDDSSNTITLNTTTNWAGAWVKLLQEKKCIFPVAIGCFIKFRPAVFMDKSRC